MSEPEELAAVAEDLYAGSPDDFVARRGEQVKLARAAKNRPLATAIGKLRRPTRSAWLVDLLARGAGEQLDELLELGTELQHAQQRRDGARLRELSSDRRRRVDALVRRAVELAAAQAYQAPEVARQEIAQTLQAALADPQVGDAVRRGVLAEAVTYGGFGPFGPELSLVPDPPADEPEPAAAPTRVDGRDDEEDPAARERAEAVERARAALAAAEEELAEAESRAEAATAEADARADEVDRLSAELASAQEAAKVADRQARGARKDVDRQREAVERARGAVRDS